MKLLDRPPPGWFVLTVCRKGARGADWLALMTDRDPDDLCRPTARACWVSIPGKHRSRDDAWDALDAAMATRH